MGREDGTLDQRFYSPLQQDGSAKEQTREEEACSGQGGVSSRWWCVPYEFSFFHVKDNRRILVIKDHHNNSNSSSGHGPTSTTHPSPSMALHSIHRVATSAKQRTKESIKRVFSSYSTVQPVATSDGGGESSNSSTTSRVAAAAAAGGGGEQDHQSTTDTPGDGTDDNDERFGSDGDRRRMNHRTNSEETSSSSDFESTSDDEGYVTANDGDSEDFEEDYHHQSLSHEGSESQRRVPNGVREESVSGQQQQQHQEWDLQLSGRRKQAVSKQDFHSALDLECQNAIQNMRTAVVKLDSDERLEKVDDATFLRFLVARNMDIKRASDMFIKDWRWRNSIAPLGYMPADAVSSQLQAEKAFLQGIDRRGRPLMILLGAKHYAKGRDMEEFQKYCFYCIEKVIASIPEGKDKFVTIIDIGGTAYKNMDIGATKLMVDLLQAHYPERMGQLFVIHSSPMIQWPYKFVEPAIDIKTRKKILFVGDENLESLMEDEIGAECVPKAYGGSADFIPLQYAKVDKSSYPSRARAVREQ